jgi:hypothetical protein
LGFLYSLTSGTLVPLISWFDIWYHSFDIWYHRLWYHLFMISCTWYHKSMISYMISWYDVIFHGYDIKKHMISYP